MNNLNSVIIEGNLTRDPEESSTPKGTPVCKFTIATNRYYKNGEQQQQQEVSFFAVETWAKLASSCYSYLEKGRGVRVVGRLKQERWTGADEKKHERIVVVAEHVEFKPQVNRTDSNSEESDIHDENSIEKSSDAIVKDDFAAVDNASFAAETHEAEAGMLQVKTKKK
ncbi:MAG: single-stranded DNA-binding protein [Spirochaetes bacterium]|nr:single-stranded DNA-binding protein [Spirochaetota bacterium]MBL7006737.1 single-stranded DNA-binding protein [Spirochaetia bacterium]